MCSSISWEDNDEVVCAWNLLAPIFELPLINSTSARPYDMENFYRLVSGNELVEMSGLHELLSHMLVV
jgi:hypothetical protein